MENRDSGIRLGLCIQAGFQFRYDPLKKSLHIRIPPNFTYGYVGPSPYEWFLPFIGCKDDFSAFAEFVGGLFWKKVSVLNCDGSIWVAEFADAVTYIPKPETKK